MITLLAVGIRATPMRPLAPIPPAASDARSVYDAFALAGTQGFDHRRSIVLIDVTAEEVRHLIRAITATLTTDDIFIFYFSGHGELAPDDSLVLCCRDADEFGRGRVGGSELRQLLGGVSSRACLAILDCCHSGAALNEANVRGLYEAQNLSVLVSAQAFERATYDEQGSIFTRALIRAIQSLSSDNEAVGLVALVRSIRSDPLNVRVLVNPSHGAADVELISASDWAGEEIGSEFSDLWLRRVHKADTGVREFLWHDLARAPDRLKFEIIGRFLRGDYPREPSWRVRRAIGDNIRSMEGVSDRKLKLVRECLESHSWMDRCIGLSAARVFCSDSSVRRRLKEILSAQTSRMDEAWLAHLYLAEYDPETALQLGLQSALMRSPWGVIDLWRRHRTAGNLGKLVERIVAARPAPIALSRLALHLLLESELLCRESSGEAFSALMPMQIEADAEIGRHLKSSQLVRQFYSAAQRSVPAPQVFLKWTMYDLYSRWRDDFRIDLRTFLRSVAPNELSRELEAFRTVPLAEIQMGLCQSLLDARPWTDVQSVQDAMAWGLEQAHPWVRRETARLFGPYDERLLGAIRVQTDARVYPGMMDLLLQGAECGATVSRDLLKLHFASPEDIDAAVWATGLESGVTSFHRSLR